MTRAREQQSERTHSLSLGARTGDGLTGCGKTRRACHSEEPQVVLSEAKEESRIAMKMRRARSFAALRMTAGKRFSAAC
jgi:hypothetical protein